MNVSRWLCNLWIDEAWDTPLENADQLTLEDTHACILKSIAAYRAVTPHQMDRDHPTYEKYILIELSHGPFSLSDASKLLGHSIVGINRRMVAHGLDDEDYQFRLELFQADEKHRLTTEEIFARARAASCR